MFVIGEFARQIGIDVEEYPGDVGIEASERTVRSGEIEVILLVWFGEKFRVDACLK